ncbi:MULTISPECIES: DUF2513 domain-containing protein [unclassified Sphingomonas]|uniref:DUF2513 domain-containing protein n=1 Tax=Sphingomonas sp. PvP015 TaxID=3156388 RepID=UPI0033945B72
MDLIRDLLLQIEGGKISFQLLDRASADALGIEPDEALSDEQVDQISLHLDMLQSAGFVGLQKLSGGYWRITEFTWAGHDFIESVRDPEIWKRTKSAASKAGGFTVGLLAAAAKGLIKGQMQKHLGLEMEF